MMGTAPTFDKNDWQTLVASIKRNDYADRDQAQRRVTFAHKGFRVRCDDTDKARETLAARIAAGAKKGPAAFQSAAARGNRARTPNRRHGDKIPRPAFTWAVVKALLADPGMTPQENVRNALVYLDQHGITPVLTADDRAKPGEPPARIVADPKPFTITAKNGEQIEMVWGFDALARSRPWVAAEPHTGLSVGQDTDKREDRIETGKKRGAQAPEFGPVLDRIAQAEKDGAARQRYKALADWCGLNAMRQQPLTV